MNTKTIKSKTLGIFLSLALILSLVAVVLPVGPVHAAVTAISIDSPITATPAYAKTGGTVTVQFDVSTGADGLGDISIKILNAGTSTIAAYRDVQYTFASAGNDDLNWAVTLTGVASGTYDVQVSARQPSGTGTWVDSTVESSALIVDNTAPVVTLTAPNGGEYVKSDAAYNITWNATDAIPAVSTVTVTAEQSTDGGTTWAATDITAVSKTKGVNSAAWGAASIPDIDSQLGKIRLTVTDDAGNSTIVTSASNFTILNTGPTASISIPLGTTVWNGGSSQNITFTTTSAFNLNVDYMLEFYNGSAWSDITSWVTNQPVGLITYPWTVNNAYRGSLAQIRVTVRDKVLRTGTNTCAAFTIRDVTAPTVTVTAPAAGAKLYNGVASSITWTASDNVAGTLTYKWYYSTDGGSSYAYISTSTEAQGTVGPKSWTPTGITTTQTNCKVKVEAIDAATALNTGTGYSGIFSIYPATTGPTVTVSAPATAASWQAGTCKTISWTTTYTPDPAALLEIEIELSDDGGSTWATLVILPNRSVGAGSFNWAADVTGAPQSDCVIRVTATDPATLYGYGDSGVFTITAEDPAATYSIEYSTVTVVDNWNLISLPIVPTCTSIESILADVLPWVNSVWYWTGGPSGSWQSYAPGAPTSLTTMAAGKAYWVNLATGHGGSFTFQGRKCTSGIGPPPSYSTVPGWNMVGFKSTATKKVEAYLGLPCPSTVYMLPIYSYSSGYVPINDCSTTDMTPGLGYWIYYNSAGTIFPGCD